MVERIQCAQLQHRHELVCDDDLIPMNAKDCRQRLVGYLHPKHWNRQFQSICGLQRQCFETDKENRAVHAAEDSAGLSVRSHDFVDSFGFGEQHQVGNGHQNRDIHPQTGSKEQKGVHDGIFFLIERN